MNIDYSISYKDALFLAQQLIQNTPSLQERILKDIEDTTEKEESEEYAQISYQVAYNLCNVADTLCYEIMNREKRRTKSQS